MESIANRKELTPDQKRQARFKRWLEAPGVKFRDKQAEKLYKARVTRFIKALSMEEGDRVPCHLPVGSFPAYYSGYTLKDVMYDYEKQRKAWLKFMHDFGDMDSYGGPGMVLSGKVLDILDYKQYSWPGHGLGTNATTHQFNEKQYISAAEYDRFLENPADFFFRVLTPRTIGAAEAWQAPTHSHGCPDGPGSPGASLVCP